RKINSPQPKSTIFPYTTLFRSVNNLIKNYNNEIQRLKIYSDTNEKLSKLNREESYVKWTRGLLNKFSQSTPIKFDGNKMIKSMRSEEHTSELQSRFDLVCRLLL